MAVRVIANVKAQCFQEDKRIDNARIVALVQVQPEPYPPVRADF